MSFSAVANPLAAPRTGSVTVALQTFTVTQAAALTICINPFHESSCVRSPLASLARRLIVCEALLSTQYRMTKTVIKKIHMGDRQCGVATVMQ